MNNEIYIVMVSIVGVFAVTLSILFGNKKNPKRHRTVYKGIIFEKATGDGEYKIVGKNLHEMTREELRGCEKFCRLNKNGELLENVTKERNKRKQKEVVVGNKTVIIVGR
jgi:hypothetical protein